MTLEDFFTLTEIKDGLMAPARVEELVNVMQKERDCVVENVSDATRQWSTVASTIAATENRDCLDRFIQLNGLWFIERWLQDAQKFGNDRGDSFTEESTIFLLRALEKLHIDKEMSISSGIWTTVKNLIDHRSSTVQDQARAIFASWTQFGDDDGVTQDVEKVGESLDTAMAGSMRLTEGSALKESSTMDVSPPKQSSTSGDHAGEAASVCILPPQGSNDFRSEKIEDVEIQKTNVKVSSHMNLDPPVEDAGPSVPLGPSVEENLSIMKESPTHRAEGTVSIETSSSPVAKQDNLRENSESLKPDEVFNDANHTCEMKTSQNESVTTDFSSVSNKLDPVAVPLISHAVDALDSTTEFGLQKKLEGKEVNMLAAEPKRERNECRSALMLNTADQGGECLSSVLKGSLDNERALVKKEDRDSSSSRLKDVGLVNKFEEQAVGGGENSINAPECLKPERSTKDRGLAAMELEYGLVDALEVARKVAKEVAQEAIHYKDSFCSTSSERKSGGSIQQPSSPDSISGKDQCTEGPPAEVSSGENLSPEASPKEDDDFISSENMEARLDNCMPDITSSPEAAEEPEVNAEKKGFCAFDLNQDVCSEDVDHVTGPTAATISLVSASRPTAAPGFPEPPLQFVGAHEWKGTATTSAFRTPSPRGIPDGDKPLSSVDGGSCSKQRHGFLDFDLNVAEGIDNETSNLVPAKQAPVTCISSGESSAEVSPRRPERLKLDLNCISDDGDALQSDGRAEWQLFSRQDDRQSPSHASSSLPMQPTVRNIDLNDPSFCNNASNAYAGTKLKDPVISLMGMKVEVSRKEFTPQILSPLQNGRIADPVAQASLQRMGTVLGLGPTMPYAHPAVYGLNGPTAGPSTSFTSPVYGPSSSIPYMVDSRGAPVVPQIVTSGSAVSRSYAQPSFFMNLTGPPSGFNGAGPSRPSFDLNSGFAMGGSRDPGGLRQLFNPNESNSMEERTRADSQASLSLRIGEKRKEPETGWEPYLFGNKLQQQPWR